MPETTSACGRLMGQLRPCAQSVAMKWKWADREWKDSYIARSNSGGNVAADDEARGNDAKSGMGAREDSAPKPAQLPVSCGEKDSRSRTFETFLLPFNATEAEHSRTSRVLQ